MLNNHFLKLNLNFQIMKHLVKLIALLAVAQPICSQNAEDEQAIRKLVQTMADGWTKGSGEQFASAFADEHDYVVWNGLYMKGINPQANAAAHQGIFESVYKDTEHYATVDKIKFIREDIALIHVLAAVAKKGEGRPADPQVLWSGLLEKTSGQWKIIAFHNLDLEIFQNEGLRQSSPMPPQVMYASWYGGQPAVGSRQ